MRKCVLAFSGGIEQLAAIRWLREQHNTGVIALVVDVGQEADLEEMGEQALLAGAFSARIEDLQTTFARDYIAPALRALAHYQESYLLYAALSRPLIAASLVRTAKEENAQCIAHGCSSQGNDQVRLEAALKVLAPKLPIVAPQREWPFKTRQEIWEYLRSRNLRLREDQSGPYRVDRNLWGQSIDCACLRLDASVPDEVFTYSVSPQKSPDLPTELELDFQGGLPVALDGRKMPLVQLIRELNVVAGACGVGRRESVEDRLVGFKSREVYDAPAAETLYAAKKALERNVLSREALFARARLAEDYGRCVYEGHWFGLLREALDAFFLCLNRVVEGKVRLRLFKGVCRITTVHSNFSLIPTQNPAASFFSRADAEGFIHLHTFTPILEGRRQNREQTK